MFKWLLPVLVLVATTGQATTVVLCTEDPGTGCIADIPTASPTLTVASDSEGGFDPFLAGFDTSDGIQLNENWVPDPAFAASFGPFGWQLIPGTFTWVLPADLGPCLSENETICEPVGKWYIPGATWNAATPDTLLMLEGDGSVSDIILVNYTGPGGSAAITFMSDPFATPEPATMTMLGLGLVGVGIASRRRKSA